MSRSTQFYLMFTTISLYAHFFFHEVGAKNRKTKQITGGNGKKLKRYCIISLKEEDLHELIEGVPTFPATITTLSYVPGDGKTTLLVGLANSQTYLVDFMAAKPELPSETKQ